VHDGVLASESKTALAVRQSRSTLIIIRHITRSIGAPV
jgi:hypothetical protein